MGARDHRLAGEAGQTTALTALFLVALIAVMAAVIDVGSWMRADRKLQADVDAAALAGAQALPESTVSATTLALDNGKKNASGLTGANITYSTSLLANDTIKVTAERTVPGFFSKVLRLASVRVHATARARTGVLNQAQYVAPISVHWRHPSLQCNPAPCAASTSIKLSDLGPASGGTAPGSFGLINLDQNSTTGTPGADVVASWLSSGFSGYMGLGHYDAVPSAQFNNSLFLAALQQRLNTELLFPVYKTITGPGGNAQYDVIGWVGFVPTRFDADGSTGTLYGSFKRVIWRGFQSTSSKASNYGDYAVQLVE